MVHRRTKNFYKNKWFYLFHALIVMLILFPYLDPHYTLHEHPFPLLILNSVVILTIIYTVSPTKKHLAVGLILSLPAIVCFWLENVSNNSTIILFSIFALYLYTILMTIRFLIRSKELSLDLVFGGISVYILIGLAWTILYQNIELYTPGSFAHSDMLTGEKRLSWSDFIYYSFTTLTTLGYGDITPLHPVARTLAIIEAITGVIFVPVIISGLLSMIITSSLNKQRDESAS